MSESSRLRLNSLFINITNDAKGYYSVIPNEAFGDLYLEPVSNRTANLLHPDDLRQKVADVWVVDHLP